MGCDLFRYPGLAFFAVYVHGKYAACLSRQRSPGAPGKLLRERKEPSLIGSGERRPVRDSGSPVLRAQREKFPAFVGQLLNINRDSANVAQESCSLLLS